MILHASYGGDEPLLLCSVALFFKSGLSYQPHVLTTLYIKKFYLLAINNK